MGMAAFLLRRLLGLVGVLLGMSVLIFGIVHILPGNVAYAILGEFATPAAVAQLEAKLGLNDPLPMQYWRWLSAMLHGDFGMSIVMQRPAAPLIAEALGRSALLAVFAFGLVAMGGIGLGLYAATHRGRTSDKVLTLAQFLLIAVPEFFWAILAVLVFAAWLRSPLSSISTEASSPSAIIASSFQAAQQATMPGKISWEQARSHRETSSFICLRKTVAGPRLTSMRCLAPAASNKLT